MYLREQIQDRWLWLTLVPQCCMFFAVLLARKGSIPAACLGDSSHLQEATFCPYGTSTLGGSSSIRTISIYNVTSKSFTSSRWLVLCLMTHTRMSSQLFVRLEWFIEHTAIWMAPSPSGCRGDPSSTQLCVVAQQSSWYDLLPYCWLFKWCNLLSVISQRTKHRWLMRRLQSSKARNEL